MKSFTENHELKTLIQKSVIGVINDLKNHLSKPVHETNYIHYVRVNIKRLRGLLRLLKIDNGNYDWHKSDQRLHDISRDMGQSRNNEVMHEVLQILYHKNKGSRERIAITALQELLPKESGLSETDWKDIKQRVDDELETIKDILIAYDFNSAQIQDGIKFTYKKTFDNGKKTFSKHGNFDDLHNLRKWMKYLNYQLGYIRDAYPEINNKFIKHVNALGDRLGKINDLVMLKNALQQINLDDDYHKTLNNLIDKNIYKKIKRAKKSYKSIFKHPPKKIIGNIFNGLAHY